MVNDFAPFASDFYVNQRINLKMDLPMRRDTVLSLFDRVRKELPHMERFRRYDHELALESRGDSASGSHHGFGGPGSHQPRGQQWLAVRKTSVRSGSVNPTTSDQAYALHELATQAAPCFLDITALDIDHVELLYGFDLPAAGNHDAIVFSALMSGSPLAALVEAKPARTSIAASSRGHIPVDFQPLLGVALTDELDVQAHVEVKTRTSARQVRTGEYRDDPISVYMIVRKYGPFADVRELPDIIAALRQRGEDLVENCIVPRLLMPIREAIVSGT
jgi:hypothetical protein